MLAMALVPLVTIPLLFLVAGLQRRAVACASAWLSFLIVTLLGFYVTPDVTVLCNVPWIDVFNAHLKIGIEPLGYAMIWVTALSTLMGVIASLREIKDDGKNLALHMALLFLIQIALYGVFTARDLFLFFIAYETVLIPMYLLILIWGGKERSYASLKFLLFTLFGSLPMLIALVALWSNGRVFDIDTLREIALARGSSVDAAVAGWVFAGFAMAFLVKIPLWPLHTWLPDAHTQAPTAGSIVLAAALLKMGCYGLAVIAIPLFPDAARAAAPLMQNLALAGIVLGAFASFAQTDAKRLIAYSSVSHMGFIVLGLFSFAHEAWLGAFMQMIAHGISTGALFYFVGAIYRRRHDRQLDSFGGLATLAPNLSAWTAVAVFSSTALPGTAGFAAEVMILFGVFTQNPVLAAIAAVAVILSAAYMLKFFKAIAFGHPTAEFKKLWDREYYDELFVMGACAILLVVIGIAPWGTVYTWLDPAVRRLLG